jgi:sn1-specific diacylglycerol lipase
MHSAANYIYDDISPRLIEIFEKYPDYTLVICGYSLGAGIASILAILLKPIYPNLKCYGIAMPGSVLSENLALATRHFINSYVVDVDMIGRASIRSLEYLRDRIIEALDKYNRNKLRILTMTLVQTLTKRRQAFHSISSRTQPLIDDSLLPTVTEIEGDSTISQILLTNRSNQREHLVMPGTIIHLYSINRVGLFSRKISYRACISTYNQFDQLIVHPRMWLDHFPASYSKALTDAIDNYDQTLQEIK